LLPRIRRLFTSRPSFGKPRKSSPAATTFDHRKCSQVPPLSLRRRRQGISCLSVTLFPCCIQLLAPASYLHLQDNIFAMSNLTSRTITPTPALPTKGEDRARSPSATLSFHPERRKFSWLHSLSIGRGIARDICRRAPYYISDWTDAWNYRVIPAIVLIFFAKFAPSLYCSDAR
jgi:hypothetical protein